MGKLKSIISSGLPAASRDESKNTMYYNVKL